MAVYGIKNYRTLDKFNDMGYLNKKESHYLKSVKEKVRALNHPLRQSILKTINDSENRMNVTDLYRRLKLEQSVASQQLAILRKQGFVETQREGKVIWYSVNHDEIDGFLDKCRGIMEEAVLVV